MNTPVATAHRNLSQRIAKLLDGAGGPPLTPWQLEVIGYALDDLEFGRFPEGEAAIARAERPDLWERPTTGTATVETLRRRLKELANS